MAKVTVQPAFSDNKTKENESTENHISSHASAKISLFVPTKCLASAEALPLIRMAFITAQNTAY